MSLEIKVPPLGESVTEATVAKWYKKTGEAVKRDELIVELETEKVTLEVTAPANGIIEEILVNEGGVVSIGAVLGKVKEGAAPAVSSSKPESKPAAMEVKSSPVSAPVASDLGLAPSVRKMTAENNIEPSSIPGTGKDGRVTKGDVINALEAGVTSSATASTRSEERVKMTKLRKTIAQRLKESQNTAAMLTTFNEVDMSNIMKLRNTYKDNFEKKHGIKLGFMSFFLKAAVVGLKEIPAVNAEIDGDDIVYKNYCDISVAVGTEKGLVVPVVRDADKMSFADIEKKIAEFGKKARDGKLTMQELTGGTFSISNGGVYGSLMSTPIINPPQSAILGMHKTMDRAVVVDGKIEIRPMMYLALSYDHRIIDGKEAVTFLVRIKECIENPERLLFDL